MEIFVHHPIMFKIQSTLHLDIHASRLLVVQPQDRTKILVFPPSSPSPFAADAVVALKSGIPASMQLLLLLLPMHLVLGMKMGDFFQIPQRSN